jgi:hypothetical protein
VLLRDYSCKRNQETAIYSEIKCQKPAMPQNVSGGRRSADRGRGPWGGVACEFVAASGRDAAGRRQRRGGAGRATGWPRGRGQTSAMQMPVCREGRRSSRRRQGGGGWLVVWRPRGSGPRSGDVIGSGDDAGPTYVGRMMAAATPDGAGRVMAMQGEGGDKDDTVCVWRIGCNRVPGRSAGRRGVGL